MHSSLLSPSFRKRELVLKSEFRYEWKEAKWVFCMCKLGNLSDIFGLHLFPSAKGAMEKTDDMVSQPPCVSKSLILDGHRDFRTLSDAHTV